MTVGGHARPSGPEGSRMVSGGGAKARKLIAVSLGPVSVPAGRPIGSSSPCVPTNPSCFFFIIVRDFFRHGGGLLHLVVCEFCGVHEGLDLSSPPCEEAR